MSGLVVKYNEMTAKQFIELWETVWGDGPLLEQTELAMKFESKFGGMVTMILHCMKKSTWNDRKKELWGKRNIEADGFIHCSTVEYFWSVAPN